MAGIVYQIAFWTVVFVIITVSAIDAWLIESGRESVTDFLLAHPAWYWWTAGILIGGSIALGIHLYLESLD